MSTDKGFARFRSAGRKRNLACAVIHIEDIHPVNEPFDNAASKQNTMFSPISKQVEKLI